MSCSSCTQPTRHRRVMTCTGEGGVQRSRHRRVMTNAQNTPKTRHCMLTLARLPSLPCHFPIAALTYLGRLRPVLPCAITCPHARAPATRELSARYGCCCILHACLIPPSIAERMYTKYTYPPPPHPLPHVCGRQVCLVARRGAALLWPLWAQNMAAGAHMRAGRQVWGLNASHLLASCLAAAVP
jgi:hypothetical protein